MKFHTSHTFAIFLIFLLSSCSNSSNQGESNDQGETDDRNEIRLKQYRVKGSEIYFQNCANCHQPDGTGLANLYPPLKGSDYLLSDLERAACVIKNGLTDEIEVSGRTFNQQMPANPQLTPLQVAEVLTFISNSWGNEAGLSGVKDVERWIENCQ